MSAPRPWPVRWPVLMGLGAIVVLLGGVAGWGITAQIEGAVIAPGRVEVERNRQVVQHPDGGVVAGISVAEGQAVAAEDLLIRLDDSELGSELAIVENQYFEVLARRARLEAERDGADALSLPPELVTAAGARPGIAALAAGQARLFEARRETLDRQLAQLDRRGAQIAAQIDGIAAQAVALDRQRALIAEELAQQAGLLERGLAQASRVLALRREAARLDGRIGELAAARAEQEGRVTEIGIEALRLAAARREEAVARLRDLSVREMDLAERRRAIRARLARLEIRAPVAGIVIGLGVFAPRAVIRPAEPLLYIVPQDRPLVVAARVDPVHVDEVFAGQEVTLRFTAFDMRRTPEIAGRVATLSPDAIEDPQTGQSWYRAEIMPLPGEMARLGGLQPLPGMPVEAYIRTGARTPLAYLVKPLADYFNRAFRES